MIDNFKSVLQLAQWFDLAPSSSKSFFSAPKPHYNSDKRPQLVKSPHCFFNLPVPSSRYKHVQYMEIIGWC